MACATLKRSLDFDPVHNHVNPTKRQRCAPMVISPSSSPPASRNEVSHSVFSGVCPRMSPGEYRSFEIENSCYYFMKRFLSYTTYQWQSHERIDPRSFLSLKHIILDSLLLNHNRDKLRNIFQLYHEHEVLIN